jgi:hypothetical protein
MTVCRPLAVFAVALLVLGGPGAAEAGKRRVPRGFFGVTWDGAAARAPYGVQDKQWGLMAANGAESVRAVVSWEQAEPDLGFFDFDRTDRLVTLAAKHGMTLLPVVIETPRWARAYPDSRFSPPRDASDFGDYLRQLAARYGPDGDFWSEHPALPQRPIRAYQIWNEPGLSYYWRAKRGSRYAWPRGYVTLLKEADQALSELHPRTGVVLAGLTNDAWNDLRSLYKRHARRYFDIAAIQAFTGTPKLALKAIRLFRQVMRHRGDGRKPIWVTETSWPAARGRMQIPLGQRTLVTTDRGAASNLRTMFRALALRRRLARYRVARVYWYTWSSPYRLLTDIFDFAGLLSYDRGKFKRKPALRAYRRVARRYEGCTKTSTGRCKRRR